ncbi:MAG: protein kinase [Solirubrobacterales bacterium]|nr:protein kinase [Solirubrobacterales bacterium]
MPHAPDLAGCALDGRYEIHELIGEGTFGRVYRGYDRRLERVVAVKVIKPWWAEDPEWVESFGREAQLLARVSDPGIVQIYDVGQADEGLYYVTELVEGESLAGRLRRGGRQPLEPWEACDIAEQLCRALEHAHDEQIVHRDIKPANVLISSRGKVKVGDLGIARLAEGTTEGGTATIVGTPRYMAPEQASGLPVTPATDVYSVGIVLYEMLAGHPPFNGDSAVEIALRHVQDTPAPLPNGTPRSLERIVRRALAKEPSERYQSAAAMADALARARTRAHDETLVTETFATLRRGSNGAGLSGAADAAEERGPTPTWVAPRYSPRHNVNPAARRRAVAAFILALGVLGVLAVAAVMLTGRPTVTLPQLHGLTEARANSLLHRRHLNAAFTKRYDAGAEPGTVVAQTPPAGARVKQDSTIDVALSNGPRPIDVPSLTGETSDAAVARLHGLHLGADVVTVPAPGTQPGVVTAQAPTAGHHLKPSQTVTLSVAETPSWQTVTTFQGARSVPFRIRGSQWRMVYTMAYDGTCNFVFFCNGPSAQVVGPGGNVSVGLNDGGTQTHVFKSGPGVYQISIGGGWDSAHWSVTVEDWY